MPVECQVSVTSRVRIIKFLEHVTMIQAGIGLLRRPFSPNRRELAHMHPKHTRAKYVMSIYIYICIRKNTICLCICIYIYIYIAFCFVLGVGGLQREEGRNTAAGRECQGWRHRAFNGFLLWMVAKSINRTVQKPWFLMILFNGFCMASKWCRILSIHRMFAPGWTSKIWFTACFPTFQVSGFGLVQYGFGSLPCNLT